MALVTGLIQCTDESPLTKVSVNINVETLGIWPQIPYSFSHKEVESIFPTLTSRQILFVRRFDNRMKGKGHGGSLGTKASVDSILPSWVLTLGPPCGESKDEMPHGERWPASQQSQLRPAPADLSADGNYVHKPC